jgi:hypothetical protein
MVEEAAEVIGQVLRRGIAAIRGLIEALQADGREVAVDAGVEGRGRVGVAGFDLFDRFEGRGSLERGAAGQVA